MTHFSEAPFTTRFTDELPAEAAHRAVDPTPVAAPRLIGWSTEVAARLGLTEPNTADVAALAGNLRPPQARWYAARYGGHQFGHWADQLGDGRAINFGELNDFEVQLKGAGRTPFSRGADGRAVLRSSLREFVCSEAMHHLGVPTTRALALVLTGDRVIRDMFYDGHAAPEPGAICTRVAPTFIRIGNFEIFAAHGELDHLRRLTAYVMRHHFPELPADDVVGFYRAVVHRTADMISAWMTHGFVHGVMNTDNMSILGLTIDYGPYGWLEEYDPRWTPNTTDLPGRRYAFGRQPEIAEWNLAQLGSALATLNEEWIPEMRAALGEFEPRYREQTARRFGMKLGFEHLDDPDDRRVHQELEILMRTSGADFTLTYRELAEFDGDVTHWLGKILYREVTPEILAPWTKWLDAYGARTKRQDPLPRRRRMNAVNPRFVPRNYLLQEAIDLAGQGDFQRIGDLMETLRRPFHEQPGREAFAQRRPEWARHKAGCSTLSCSS